MLRSAKTSVSFGGRELPEHPIAYLARTYLKIV